jgi:hypothetical protein
MPVQWGLSLPANSCGVSALLQRVAALDYLYATAQVLAQTTHVTKSANYINSRSATPVPHRLV